MFFVFILSCASRNQIVIGEALLDKYSKHLELCVSCPILKPSNFLARFLFKVFLRLTLLVLVVFQSITVIADAHQFYQSSAQYLPVFDHAHYDDVTNDDLTQNVINNNAAQISVPNHTDQAVDCDHCCHCHSAAIPLSILGVATHKPYAANPVYKLQFTLNHPSSLYRPPIA